ncbi:peptidase domain-containing protein [uncultured Methanomethylovorans sp.]|uniref:peptidase domain-containing protein n=1 Tax=uncultured Methanomethylovorans sp. TaxID=183759 RepID=UPI0037496B7B
MNRIIMGFVVFLLCITVAGASVSDCENEVSLISASDLGYKIIPAEMSDSDIGIKSVYDTITQGETNWHSKTVSTNIQSMTVNLNWGDTSDSLRLSIYNPNNYCIGTYYDSADGTINGRIRIYITNSNGIEKGTWKYKVYGYSVSGTEDYSI